MSSTFTKKQKLCLAKVTPYIKILSRIQAENAKTEKQLKELKELLDESPELLKFDLAGGEDIPSGGNSDLKRIDSAIQGQLKEVYEQLHAANKSKTPNGNLKNHEKVIDGMRKKPLLKDLFNLNECEYFLETKRTKKLILPLKNPQFEKLVEKPLNTHVSDAGSATDPFERLLQREFEKQQPQGKKVHKLAKNMESHELFLMKLCDEFDQIHDKLGPKTTILANKTLLMFYYARLSYAFSFEDRQKIFIDMRKTPSVVELFLQNEVAQFRASSSFSVNPIFQSNLNMIFNSLEKDKSQKARDAWKRSKAYWEIYEMFEKRYEGNGEEQESSEVSEDDDKENAPLHFQERNLENIEMGFETVEADEFPELSRQFGKSSNKLNLEKGEAQYEKLEIGNMELEDFEADNHEKLNDSFELIQTEDCKVRNTNQNN